MLHCDVFPRTVCTLGGRTLRFGGLTFFIWRQETFGESESITKSPCLSASPKQNETRRETFNIFIREIGTTEDHSGKVSDVTCDTLG